MLAGPASIIAVARAIRCDLRPFDTARAWPDTSRGQDRRTGGGQSIGNSRIKPSLSGPSSFREKPDVASDEECGGIEDLFFELRMTDQPLGERRVARMLLPGRRLQQPPQAVDDEIVLFEHPRQHGFQSVGLAKDRAHRRLELAAGKRGDKRERRDRELRLEQQVREQNVHDRGRRLGRLSSRLRRRLQLGMEPRMFFRNGFGGTSHIHEHPPPTATCTATETAPVAYQAREMPQDPRPARS